jgi:hypothetical protein
MDVIPAQVEQVRWVRSELELELKAEQGGAVGCSC